MTRQRDDATEAQVRAANPAGSAWLAANAGSGKTRVLTDRVARLLLQGADPRQILCLTYTKAAATEMQNRLFKRLGEWAMLDADALKDALLELGEDQNIDPESIRTARTLFARAIEVPGGLKIQTIHSFCSGLLRRFPLEAGVNPQFEEIEQRTTQLLQRDIVERMIDGPEHDAVTSLMTHYTGADFERFLEDIVRHQEALSNTSSWSEITTQFGLPEDINDESLARLVFLGDEEHLFSLLVPSLEQSGVNDQKLATNLKSITRFDASSLPDLQNALLTKDGQPKKRVATKKTQTEHPDAYDALENLMHRVFEAREKGNALHAARKTFALHRFSKPFLQHYAAVKSDLGYLDFDDLILRTRMLLQDDKVAAWVLYRLDGGISHLLVDEAQDTSPAQWDVIRLLTQEFTSGLGSESGKTRTLFVVGDKKQSIYSFQGADPDEFDRMEQEFAHKLRAVGKPFSSQRLEYSFRSSDAILRLVDQTFDGVARAGFTADQKHKAFHSDKPGRVDLWPVVPKSDINDDRHWADPVDLVPSAHHSVVLANHVAQQISAMLDTENPTYIPEKQDGHYHLRPVRAQDILILVQRRSLLFHEIIRACKSRNLPIAGADRLRVGAELAVRDLLAFLSFLVTPEDSLSLATVLRSPLFGWSEQQLFSLAHDRAETYLWETFRNQKQDHFDHYSVVEDLRANIDFLRPFDLLERILTRHKGREKLIARLGVEAEDGINAILAQALAYERVSIPSLTGFLLWAKADDLEIKRQVDSAGNLIRVMTVHGAKGLEAPIVILPDCGNRKLEVRDDILKSDDRALWRTNASHAPETIKNIVDKKKAAEQRERQRLLYVAMTRAETWLIVAASGELSKDGSDWHQTVDAGMSAVGAFDFEYAAGKGRRFEFGDWNLQIAPQHSFKQSDETVLEPYFLENAQTPTMQRPALSPSDLGGAKALPSEFGQDEEVALARGTYVHALLDAASQGEPGHWKTRVHATPAPTLLDPSLIEESRAEVMRVLQNPDLAWIFDPTALAEVTVHGTLGDDSVTGTIDRLVVSTDTVTIIDFKTNTAVPKSASTCPEGILLQMGAYSHVIQQIYPEHHVQTGIVWTANSTFMSLPQNMVIEAVKRTHHLDATQGAT